MYENTKISVIQMTNKKLDWQVKTKTNGFYKLIATS